MVTTTHERVCDYLAANAEVAHRDGSVAYLLHGVLDFFRPILEDQEALRETTKHFLIEAAGSVGEDVAFFNLLQVLHHAGNSDGYATVRNVLDDLSSVHRERALRLGGYLGDLISPLGRHECTLFVYIACELGRTGQEAKAREFAHRVFRNACRSGPMRAEAFFQTYRPIFDRWADEPSAIAQWAVYAGITGSAALVARVVPVGRPLSDDAVKRAVEAELDVIEQWCLEEGVAYGSPEVFQTFLANGIHIREDTLGHWRAQAVGRGDFARCA